MSEPDAQPGTGGAAGAARRSNPWKVAFVIVLVVGLLAIAVWLLLGSRLLVVREIQVSGAERTERGAVVDAVGVPTGMPLARVDTAVAAERAEQLRLVREADVRRSWPATLEVAITERTPVLSVRAEGGFQLVDADGVLVVDSDERPADRPLVAVRGAIEGNDGVAAAAEVATALDDDTLRTVQEIDATQTGEMRLRLAQDAEVEWGDDSRPERKATILRTLLAEHAPEPGRVYDVSAPDVAIVR